MKKLLILLAIFSLLLVGSVLGDPLMDIPETEFDFGFTPQNSKVSHDFWLYSVGDDTLKILRVVPG